MGTSRKHRRWIERVLEFVSEKTGLAYLLPTDISKHIKVELFFESDPAKTCLWVVGSTPSDRRACQNAIQTLKRAIHQRFGIVINEPLRAFGFEMVVSVEDSIRQAQQRREQLWDAMFAELERMDPDTDEGE